MADCVGKPGQSGRPKRPTAFCCFHRSTRPCQRSLLLRLAVSAEPPSSILLVGVPRQFSLPRQPRVHQLSAGEWQLQLAAKSVDATWRERHARGARSILPATLAKERSASRDTVGHRAACRGLAEARVRVAVVERSVAARPSAVHTPHAGARGSASPPPPTARPRRVACCRVRSLGMGEPLCWPMNLWAHPRGTAQRGVSPG